MAWHSTRRQFLKAATVGGVTGLAGCIDSFTGGSDSNATIEYWEYWHSQSQLAEDLMKSSIKEFEQNHDVTMKMNWSSYSDITGGKWKSDILNGNFPVIYDSSNCHDGQFIKPGWVKPVNEYIDRLDKDVRKNIKPALDSASSSYRGFKNDVYEIPVGMEVGAPFIARADHFEKAGLSIEEDFPPKNYDHLIQVAKQLQKKGPGKWGFQIYGSSGDITDEAVVTWSSSTAGIDGLYLNEDWTDVNYDNNAWKTALTQWVDIYRKYGLSSPKAGSASNEAVSQAVVAGNVSMAQVSTKNFMLIRNRAPKMLKEGTIQFGPSWKGQAGNRGDYWFQVVALLRRPPDVDKQTWQTREELAIEWINKVLSKDFQKQVPKSLGTLPTRQDVREEIKGGKIGGKSNYISTLNTIASNTSGCWSAHPDMAPIQYKIPGPLFQQAVLGKISPEQACETAAKQVRNQIDL